MQNTRLMNFKRLVYNQFAKVFETIFLCFKNLTMEEVLKVLLEIKNEIAISHLLSKEVFSLQQFCKFADISENYGYKLTSERKIRFYRPGGKKIYIDRADVIAYLRQNPIESYETTTGEAINYLLTSKTIA